MRFSKPSYVGFDRAQGLRPRDPPCAGHGLNPRPPTWRWRANPLVPPPAVAGVGSAHTAGGAAGLGAWPSATSPFAPTPGGRARRHGDGPQRTVAAAVAYRFASATLCPRTGTAHDYTARATHVYDCGFQTATRTPLADSAENWIEGIESAEKRNDSRLFRDVQGALPSELTLEQQKGLVRRFTRLLCFHYSTVIPVVIHRPGEKGSDKNWHFHALLPTRRLRVDGTLGPKIRELDLSWKSRHEIKFIRHLFEQCTNEALAEAGLDVRIDVGRTKDPEPTLGADATALEREAREGKSGRKTGVELKTWRCHNSSATATR